jgi:hypothetical protein
MRPRPAILAAALTAAAMGAPVRAHGEVVSGDVNLLVEEKFLDTVEWEPTDRQGELGLMTNWQGRSWPVAVAADFLAASREAPFQGGVYTQQQARTFELDLGARKIWQARWDLRPYAGIGPALAYARLQNLGPVQTISSSDSGAGFWMDAGVFYIFTDVLNIGIDVRYSYAKVRLFGLDKDAGGLHVGLLAGYHFGR